MLGLGKNWAARKTDLGSGVDGNRHPSFLLETLVPIFGRFFCGHRAVYPTRTAIGGNGFPVARSRCHRSPLRNGLGCLRRIGAPTVFRPISGHVSAEKPTTGKPAGGDRANWSLLFDHNAIVEPGRKPAASGAGRLRVFARHGGRTSFPNVSQCARQNLVRYSGQLSVCRSVICKPISFAW